MIGEARVLLIQQKTRQKIKKKMDNLDINSKSLSDSIGVNPSVLHNFLVKEKGIKFNTLIRIFLALEIKRLDLF